ncbi:hypothetical protein SNEBB_005519 [Seison nebaliae]|nr:hypothetical protein SNEBB_005519 [Seison nebaliae]
MQQRTSIHTLRSHYSSNFADVDVDLNSAVSSTESIAEVTTELLTEEELEKLKPHLPLSTTYNPWRLLFSTRNDGYSLSTLLRSMPIDRETVCLIIVKDMHGNRFGAVTSHCLRIATSNEFSGTSDCALFTFTPEFRYYPANMSHGLLYQITADQILFGCGDGKYSLSFGSDLDRGTTASTNSYRNNPLTTNDDESVGDKDIIDFRIEHLDVFGFFVGPINNRLLKRPVFS